MLTDLKPCPFCGGKAHESNGWVSCAYGCASLSIDDWNRRAKKSKAMAEAQVPAGEIIMYAPYGKLSAPFARPEWRGGALPPVGTKLYTTAQPPAPCPKCAENAAFRLLAVEHANVTANEALGYQKSIRDLQAKVAELEQFKQMWAISCAERDALQTNVAEIEESARKSALNVGNWHRQFMKAMETVAEQYTLIEQCEQALKNENALQRGYQYRGGVPIRSIAAEALAAIASHKKGGSE